MSELHVDESGTPGSEAVVFLHADGISGRMWADHMERLSEYHCLAPDLPGFGRSNHLNWQSLPHTADLVANIIREKIPARSTHLVGVSLGGGVAHNLIARYSDILDTVIIDGAGVLPYRFAPLVKLGVNLLSPFIRTKPVIEVTSRMFALDEQDKRDLLAASPDSFRRALNDANDQRLRNEELVSPCRTLLVAGERDLPMVRPSNAALADLMPYAKARYIPQHGHAWMNRKPDLHERMVSAWITGSELPAALEQETSPWPRSKVNRLLDQDSTRST